MVADSPRRGSRPSCFHQQTRHGIEALLLGEVRAEVLVELIDARDAADGELPLRLLADVLIVLDVELVVDLADDLLDHVLDRHEARTRRRTRRRRCAM